MTNQPLTVCPAIPSPRHLLAEGGRRLAALGLDPMGAVYAPHQAWSRAGDGPAPAAHAVYYVMHAPCIYSLLSVSFVCSWGPDEMGGARTAVTVRRIVIDTDMSALEASAGEVYDHISDHAGGWRAYRCDPRHTIVPGGWRECEAATLQGDVQDAANGNGSGGAE